MLSPNYEGALLISGLKLLHLRRINPFHDYFAAFGYTYRFS